MSNKKMPVTIKMGPNALFIYFCRKFATTGTLNSDSTIRKPNIAYANILPTIYEIPDKNTILEWAIFLDKNETAAIFVAKGHGLIEVRMPSQKAVRIIIN